MLKPGFNKLIRPLPGHALSLDLNSDQKRVNIDEPKSVRYSRSALGSANP
jgi:hypothetical protein